MDELQRLNSLQAMGVLPLVARGALPGAKTSMTIPLVLPKPAIPTQVGNPELGGKQISVNRPQSAGPAGLGQARELLGANNDIRAVQKKTAIQRVAEPTESRGEAPTEQVSPQFELLCLCYENKLGFVVSLGNEQADIARQMCSEIASVLLAKPKVPVMTQHAFHWPLQQAGLSRDFSAAQDVFKGVLAAQLSGAEQLVLIGEIPVRLLTNDVATQFQWIDCNKRRCLVLPELNQLLAEPMLKKQLLLSILVSEAK